MMRSNIRSISGATQEEELKNQSKGSGIRLLANNKPRAPVVRGGGGPSPVGNRSDSPIRHTRSGNQPKITNSRGTNNSAKPGPPPVPRGSSSFMGGSRFREIKTPDTAKPSANAPKERVRGSSRTSSTTTPKNHNIVGHLRTASATSLEDHGGRLSNSIGIVSKVLGISNRKDHGSIASKPAKVTNVEDRGGGFDDSIGTVSKVLSTLNRASKAPTTKTSQISMANQTNKGNARSLPNNNLQGRDNDSASVANEQHTGHVPSSNRKENNVVQKPANASDQSTERHKVQANADLSVVVAGSSSKQLANASEASIKLTLPQPHPEIRGCPPPREYLLQQWMKGPTNPEGSLVNVSNCPSLCMSVHGNEACVGSSDHALYIIDCQKCTFVRALYGKQYGHTEWVTCCDYLQDGRILSGGMDGKLCLWDKKGVRANDLKGHVASISAVKAGAEGSLAVSASYDKTLMLWNVNRLQTKAAGCLKGHKGAVLGFCLSSQGSIVSGSRDGDVILWDTAHATPLRHVNSAHEGHVTACECLEDIRNKTWENCREFYLTGGQDGILQVWDFRTRGPVHTLPLHRNAVGKGALSNIAVSYTATGAGPLVVTAGADNMIKVIEPRKGFEVLHTLSSHHDFIYSLYVAGPLVWSGSGDGSLLVHELITGQCLYGLGADSKGAVRCISLAGPDRLVVAGDDGNIMVYAL